MVTDSTPIMLATTPPAPSPIITGLEIYPIASQYLNTAFPITGAFWLSTPSSSLTVDGASDPAAFTKQACHLKFEHPGFTTRGGHHVSITLSGVTATSNTFAVL